MVTYLCRSHVLRPSLSTERRRGRALKFSFADVVLTRAIARLLTAGASVAALKGALATLSRRLEGMPQDALAMKRIVIVGQKVYLPDGHNQFVELTANGQVAFSFALDATGIMPSESVRRSSRVRSARGARRGDL